MSQKKRASLLILVICIPLLLAGSIFAILFPTGINMIFGTHFSHNLQADIKVARESLSLAELPQSAADFHRQDWSNSFSGGVYLKLSAPADEIDKFLHESEGLKGKQPARLTSDDLVNTYFEELPWFNPSLDMSDVYEVLGEDSFGYVIYDRENDTIYIMVTW